MKVSVEAKYVLVPDAKTKQFKICFMLNKVEMARFVVDESGVVVTTVLLPESYRDQMIDLIADSSKEASNFILLDNAKYTKIYKQTVKKSNIDDLFNNSKLFGYFIANTEQFCFQFIRTLVGALDAEAVLLAQVEQSEYNEIFKSKVLGLRTNVH